MTANKTDKNEAPGYGEDQENKNKTGWKRWLIELIETIVLAVVLFFAVDAVFARVRVQNISMEPTLMPGDFLLVSKLAYRLGEMKTGDVVVFHYPGNTEEDYIKRLIGKPGDTVRVDQGIVYVNDQALVEPYIMARPNYEGEWTVPEESLFVLGDNRNDSSDSHDWGYVPVSYLVGKALVTYWPFSAMGAMPYPTLVSTGEQP